MKIDLSSSSALLPRMPPSNVHKKCITVGLFEETRSLSSQTVLVSHSSKIRVVSSAMVNLFWHCNFHVEQTICCLLCVSFSWHLGREAVFGVFQCQIVPDSAQDDSKRRPKTDPIQLKTEGFGIGNDHFMQTSQEPATLWVI